jgi:hypothetical protein
MSIGAENGKGAEMHKDKRQKIKKHDAFCFKPEIGRKERGIIKFV